MAVTPPTQDQVNALILLTSQSYQVIGTAPSGKYLTALANATQAQIFDEDGNITGGGYGIDIGSATQVVLCYFQEKGIADLAGLPAPAVPDFVSFLVACYQDIQ